MANPRARLVRIRHALTPAEWAKVGGMTSLSSGSRAGWGLLALALSGITTSQQGRGLRRRHGRARLHARDAPRLRRRPHRRHRQHDAQAHRRGKRPLSVGFFFSLGHSTVVFVLAVVLNFGIRRRRPGRAERQGSSLHKWTGIIGTSDLGDVPVSDRRPQPGRADLDREGLTGDAAGEVRRRGARASAQQPGAHEPVLRPGYAEACRHACEDVPDRGPLRARLRHRHRGGPPRARRERP